MIKTYQAGRLNKLLVGAIGAIGVCLICTGCSSLQPQNISLPSRDKDSGAWKPDGPTTQFPEPTRQSDKSIEGLVSMLYAHRDHWRATSASLLGQRNNLSHGLFVGTLTSAIAAIRESKEGVLIGGGIAGLSSTGATYLKLTEQQANYSKAADAMQCAINVLTPIPQSTWLYFFDASGEVNLEDKDSSQVSEVYELQRTLILARSTVVDWLLKAQFSIAFSPESKEVLKSRIQDLIKAETEAKSKAATAATSLDNMSKSRKAEATALRPQTSGSAPVTPMPDRPSAVNLERALKANAEVKLCLAQLSQ